MSSADHVRSRTSQPRSLKNLTSWLLKPSATRDVLLVIIAALLLTLPFADQAFHIDDREIMEFAKTQADHPLQFFLTDYYYVGNTYDVFVASHPPLVYSLVAASIVIAGQAAEIPAHASLFIFPVIAGISMYSLGRRFTRSPLAAGLLLLGSMAFLVISHELAADTPGTSLWLAAIACYVHGADRSSRRLLALSALFLLLATLTLYQSLSLVPLLFVYALVNRRLSLKTVLPLLVPIVTYAALYLFLLTSSGHPPPSSYRAGLRIGWDDPGIKARQMLSYIGVGAVFSPALIVALLRKRNDILIAGPVVLAALAAGVIWPYASGTMTWQQASMLVPMLAGGVLVIYQAFKGTVLGIAGWKYGRGATADDAFLSIWILGVLFYSYVLLPYANITHLIPLIPPVVLMFVRAVDGMTDRDLRSAFLTSALILGILLVSLPAAISEYRLAGSYRSLAGDIKTRYEGSGKQVWFAGEFDFRYYMEEEGFPNLVPSAPVKNGDIIVRATTCSEIGDHVFIPPPPAEITVKSSKSYFMDDFPVRTRSPWAGACLYDEFMGPLPLAYSRAPMEEITYYEVRL